MTSAQIKGQHQEVADLRDARVDRCPDCDGPAWDMGIDFKAPKRTDRKGWLVVEAFIRSGKRYDRQ